MKNMTKKQITMKQSNIINIIIKTIKIIKERIIAIITRHKITNHIKKSLITIINKIITIMNLINKNIDFTLKMAIIKIIITSPITTTIDIKIKTNIMITKSNIKININRKMDTIKRLNILNILKIII